jgi:hypothetical protein
VLSDCVIFEKVSMNNKKGDCFMRGGFRENAGRPQGVPNKATKEIRELLAPLDQAAVDRLRKLIDSDDDAVAFKCVELTLSYLYGRPRAAVEIEATSKRQMITADELESLGLTDYQINRLAGIPE